jgi:putative two-component system response regulator
MRVLIVDDSPTNLRVYLAIVSQIAGIEATTFTSSVQALAWCVTSEPDLLILDYRMPALDGLTFIAEYRALRPGAETPTPIVMITVEEDRGVRHRALELGASDFLTKPADPVEFLARVRNLLALHESRVALRDRAESRCAIGPSRCKKPSSARRARSSIARKRRSSVSCASPDSATTKPATTSRAWGSTPGSSAGCSG